MNTLRTLSLRFAAAATVGMFGIQKSLAYFGGPIPAIPGTPGTAPDTEAVRDIIIRALEIVLSFLALIAVIVIVIAGIRLIASQGEEDVKEKAKKTIFYAIAGLLIVLFARVIVGFITGLGDII